MKRIIVGLSFTGLLLSALGMIKATVGSYELTGEGIIQIIGFVICVFSLLKYLDLGGGTGGGGSPISYPGGW